MSELWSCHQKAVIASGTVFRILFLSPKGQWKFSKNIFSKKKVTLLLPPSPSPRTLFWSFSGSISGTVQGVYLAVPEGECASTNGTPPKGAFGAVLYCLFVFILKYILNILIRARSDALNIREVSDYRVKQLSLESAILNYFLNSVSKISVPQLIIVLFNHQAPCLCLFTSLLVWLSPSVCPPVQARRWNGH